MVKDEKTLSNENNRIPVVGLTGGIGSGKSTVAKLAKDNFPVMVISSDEVAREQMTPGGISYQAVIKEFGTSFLKENGEIDRPKLAELIFAEDEKVKRMNAITHPNVKEFVLDTIAQCKRENKVKAVIVETALLFEADFDVFCDEIWYVKASEVTRRERLRKSRGYSEEKITAIFQKQEEEALVCSKSDKIITNDETTTTEQLITQLSKLFKTLVAKS